MVVDHSIVQKKNDIVVDQYCRLIVLYQYNPEYIMYVVKHNTVNSPNNGHFGTWASVLYSVSVLYWGVLIKPLPHDLNNAFDTLDSTITHFNN